MVWTFTGDGDTSLNKGDRKTDTTARQNYYLLSGENPHASDRQWGPSSQHPGVVLHAWGDGRASAINDNIDGNVYLHDITRNGREVDNTE